MLVKKGNKTLVMSRSGKTLGTHESRKAALKQLRAVEWSKSKNKFEDGGFLTKKDKDISNRVSYLRRLKEYRDKEKDDAYARDRYDTEISDSEYKLINDIETPLANDEIEQKKRFMEERKKRLSKQ